MNKDYACTRRRNSCSRCRHRRSGCRRCPDRRSRFDGPLPDGPPDSVGNQITYIGKTAAEILKQVRFRPLPVGF